MNKDIITFLNKCKIPFETEQQLEGMLIPRDLLLSEDIYNNIKKEIPVIKKFYSSSGMKSLQQNASEKERWPLLNLVRQLLKASNYNMRPIRKCDGYTLEKKKKYKRYFRIEGLKKVESIQIIELPKE
jgi:hypothetical protein